MLTIEDIRSPDTKSGFSHVRFEDVPGRPKPYAAQAHPRSNPPAGEGTWAWSGPHRSTAEEAAQDYCDYMNGQAPQGAVRNKVGRLVVDLARAGHGRVAKGTVRRKRRARKPRTPKLGYIYCIGEQVPWAEKVAGLAAVKVGYSDKPALRIGTLQTGNPRKLVILGVLRGTRADERELHAEYQPHNILGEWFRPTPELLSEFDIEEMA